MAKLALRERYAAKIKGDLACFDRIVLTGNLPDIGHPEAMTKASGRQGHTDLRLRHVGQAPQ
jgi:hypothetical protein